MNGIARILVLLGKNFALTAACVMLWLLLGYGVGSLVAAWRYPAAGQFRSGRAVNVSYEALGRYDDLRDSVVGFSAWCGLITAQSVFIVYRIGDNRPQAERAGGFPVLQEMRT